MRFALWVNVSNAPVEIAELKISVAPQPGDWATCARAWTNGQGNYYTVFFRDRAVIDTRRSIMIDRCDQEQYSTLGTNF